MTSFTDKFPAWPKTPRLNRNVCITEKIDGTNGLISIGRVPFGSGAEQRDGYITVADFDAPLGGDGLPQWEWQIRVGSRRRWLTPSADNFGFFKWVNDNAVELVRLGPGHHYGEWYGHGIQRGYGLTERRFALFNVGRWKDARQPLWQGAEGYPYPRAVQVPDCVTTVPLLLVTTGDRRDVWAAITIGALEKAGSAAVPGFERPEGIIIFNEAHSTYEKAFTKWEAK